MKRHYGPPPSIGWWPATRLPFCNPVLRWWNGHWWSEWAVETDSPKLAAEMATRNSGYSTDEIMWSERPASWPARSRT